MYQPWGKVYTKMIVVPDFPEHSLVEELNNKGSYK